MGETHERELAQEHYEPPMPEGDEPPPPGAKVMAVVRWIILAAAVMLAIFTWLSFARAQFNATDGAPAHVQPKYHCPMHPQIVSDEPGECPICHMQLEPLAADRSVPAPSPTEAGAMGTMAAQAPGTGPVPVGLAATAPATAPGTTPSGTVSIKLALDRVQAVGVRTALVTEKEVERTLRVTAVVAAPEQGVAEVHTRSAGFVEQITVAETGVAVGGGQMLVAIYSPELYQAQTELLTATQWSVGDGGPRVGDSARTKLRLLGMADGDIDRAIARREPLRAIPIYAPQGGVISKKNVVLGSYVTPEMTLYEIQDLSRVYVIADVFQKDVGALHVGMEGRFVAATPPLTAVVARLDLIYPTLNVEARTTRVRMQIENNSRRLSPGAYGDVDFALSKKRVLVVPRDSVVDTGTLTYVFVVEGEGRYTPRSITVAESEGDDVMVDAGLTAGDRVVSGATFLIDSESRLQASAQAAPVVSSPHGGPSSSEGPSCDVDFDRVKFPDKWTDCEKCSQVHHGMGSMEADCKNAIPKPWK